MEQLNNNEPIKYTIYIPAGNNTAFVYGFNYSKEQKKLINDAIMKKHSGIDKVEQVGFIDPNAEQPELQMAGGEFCGNATRSSAYIYLNGKPGSLKMIVNSKDLINAGVDENHKAWCEIPLYHGEDVVTEMEHGIFIVKMNGMVTVVIQDEKARAYLEVRDEEQLKKYGMDFIHKYNLEYSEAVGVMFCEKVDEMIKINPVVWVKSIDTLFNETACGSGTTATCMVEAFNKKQSQKIDVLQPSGLIITADITFENEKITKAVISGDVKTDGIIYSLDLEEV